ncbi:hypothetical protein MM221_05060 [Salipaludibacillus sp. LMS25]|nr:hypothetical protein [Salipaludibacillus sp. LMS25]UTR15931.1 hypothetical protein MM221_05060 [Salipaludibacillus sp. LMS25]
MKKIISSSIILSLLAFVQFTFLGEIGQDYSKSAENIYGIQSKSEML